MSPVDRQERYHDNRPGEIEAVERALQEANDAPAGTDYYFEHLAKAAITALDAFRAEVSDVSR